MVGRGLAERDERRELDLRQGLLTRTVTLTAPQGRVLRIVQRRLVSMDRPHLACLETTLIPVGWSGRISIRSGIGTAALNANALDPGEPVTRHLGTPVIEHLPRIVLAEVETTGSRVRIALAVRTTVSGADSRPVPEDTQDGQAAVRFDITVVDGKPPVACKLAAIVNSRDDAIASTRDGVLAELA